MIVFRLTIEMVYIMFLVQLITTFQGEKMGRWIILAIGVLDIVYVENLL